MINKIAILTTDHHKSPKVLANSFKESCREIGIQAEVFTQGSSVLSRLFNIFEKTHYSRKFTFKIRQKIYYAIHDFLFLEQLKKYDLLIISDCIPNVYLRGYYNIERLKKIIKKPVALYEVYYLGNSITHTEFLRKNNHHSISRYDWNFSISSISEIRNKPSAYLHWSAIGLNLFASHLKPIPKKEIIAVVDFEQLGYSEERQLQLSVLRKFPSIKIISLDRSYTIDEIRNIYKSASLFLVQFPEAFGVSIAECLSFGCMIILKQIDWAMSWRLLNEEDKEYLPDCFYVYQNQYQLEEFLLKFVERFNTDNISQKVFDRFIDHYPSFYYGDANKLKESLIELNNYLERKS